MLFESDSVMEVYWGQCLPMYFWYGVGSRVLNVEANVFLDGSEYSAAEWISWLFKISLTLQGLPGKSRAGSAAALRDRYCGNAAGGP